MNKTYTVTQITRYIKDLITNDIFLSSLYITGEISNLKLHTSSHIYFTLKDENCSIKAVMFSNYTKTLRFVPKDGMKVIVYGSVTVYEKAGQYQLTVSSIVPEGLGELYLAFEQLKEKLRLKGYFTREKKQIPEYPKSVAIITSKTGAALKDFLNVAQRRAKGIPIRIYNSLVQGPDAAKQIVRQLKLINEQNEADIIVIARGGGSIEELWPFNEEILADAIYDSKIPIVTGIGHETDFTIADMTADLRAPTPSAAAEIVFPDMFSADMNIIAAYEKAKMIMKSKLNDASAKLNRLMDRGIISKPDVFFDKYKQEIDHIEDRIKDLFTVKLRFDGQKLSNIDDMLNKVNPYSILKKGYSYTTDINGRRISSIKDISPDMEIWIKYHDGSYSAKVKDVKSDERD